MVIHSYSYYSWITILFYSSYLRYPLLIFYSSYSWITWITWIILWHTAYRWFQSCPQSLTMGKGLSSSSQHWLGRRACHTPLSNTDGIYQRRTWDPRMDSKLAGGRLGPQNPLLVVGRRSSRCKYTPRWAIESVWIQDSRGSSSFAISSFAISSFAISSSSSSSLFSC